MLDVTSTSTVAKSARFIFLPNVQSDRMAGGEACGSNGLGAKALRLLFCRQALRLSCGMSDRCSTKVWTSLSAYLLLA